MKLDSIGSLFAVSWKQLERHFAVAVKVLAVPVALFVISQMLFGYRSPAAGILGGFISLVGTLAIMIASIALTSLFGKGTNFSESYGVGFKLFWPGVWIAILTALAVFGGFVLFIIPGIMLAIQITLSTYVLVMEDKHGLQALATSREYIKGYWWAFWGRSLLLSLCMIALMVVLYFPAIIILGKVLSALIYGVIMLFFIPFSIAYHLEIFQNLRRIKPNVEVDSLKAKTGFLKTMMVFGIVAIVGFMIAVAFAISFFIQRAIPPQDANGYGAGVETTSTLQQDGQMLELAPTSGPVGTMVTLSDSFNEFEATNTIIMNGYMAVRNVAISNDGTLTFAIPSNLGPDCDPHQACPQFLVAVKPGDYGIVVKNSQGEVPIGGFTVTSK